MGVDGVYSGLIVACCGITAGAGHATRELKLFTMELVETIAERFPHVNCTLYVDDLTLEAEGK